VAKGQRRFLFAQRTQIIIYGHDIPLGFACGQSSPNGKFGIDGLAIR
jgi:hypothetical protein